MPLHPIIFKNQLDFLSNPKPIPFHFLHHTYIVHENPSSRDPPDRIDYAK